MADMAQVATSVEGMTLVERVQTILIAIHGTTVPLPWVTRIADGFWGGESGITPDNANLAERMIHDLRQYCMSKAERKEAEAAGNTARNDARETFRTEVTLGES